MTSRQVLAFHCSFQKPILDAKSFDLRLGTRLIFFSYVKRCLAQIEHAEYYKHVL